MQEINGININYTMYGQNNKQAILLLHGWGQNIEMMKPIGDRLSKEYNILIVDLPGFGKSSEPNRILTIYDYVDLIHNLLINLNIKNPIIIGHSFGGKIALVYASKYETCKLVLLASPYKQNIKKLTLKTKILKSLKKVPVLNSLEHFAKKHIGSTDYKNSSDMMRKILVKHVNLDVTDDARNIKCPTLLIWGTKDEAVPLEDGYSLNKIIKDSGIVVYEGCTHYAYLERLGQTINVLYSFFGG